MGAPDDEKAKADAAAKAAAEAAAPKGAKKAKPDEADAEPRRVVPLPVTRWQLGEFLNNRHSVSPAVGTPFEDVLRPEFWANIVRMQPGDIIEVRPEDQSYYAELYVLKRERNSATVAVIREPVKLEAAYKPLPGEVLFSVEFAGPMAKWRVVRRSDKSVMKDKFGTEGDARRWLADYERVVAA
ncbi:hypothetical protein ACVWW6_006031 [Bradyrhizobium sp. USDA 3311]